MKKIKIKSDKILPLGKSPLDSELYWDEEVELLGETGVEADAEELVVSGEMDVGRGGNPVTITLVDEVTGMEMELSHVRNALLVVEDRRRSTSGWLSLLVGDVHRVGEVLRFIARATIDELKKLTRREKSRD